MLSVDTNILLYAYNQDCDEHAAATAFLIDCSRRNDIAVCELVLVELYQLLRSPAVLKQPLDAPESAAVCRAFRLNPRWALIEHAPVMERVWALAAEPGVTRRRLFDARLGFTLRHHGVREFATRNTKDFGGFGFDRVWDPTASSAVDE